MHTHRQFIARVAGPQSHTVNVIAFHKSSSVRSTRVLHALDAAVALRHYRLALDLQHFDVAIVFALQTGFSRFQLRLQSRSLQLITI